MTTTTTTLQDAEIAFLPAIIQFVENVTKNPLGIGAYALMLQANIQLALPNLFAAENAKITTDLGAILAKAQAAASAAAPKA